MALKDDFDGKAVAKSEGDNLTDDMDTLISIKEERASYGTMDNELKSKRFCFKMPDGKMVYAHHASQPDSLMNNNKPEEGGIFNFGQRNDRLENYFRAIDYLEHNIDFPCDSDDDPVELYSFQKHIFFILTTLMFLLNVGSFYLAFHNKNKVVDNLTKNPKGTNNRSSFVSVFIMTCLAIDGILFMIIIISGWLAY